MRQFLSGAIVLLAAIAFMAPKANATNGHQLMGVGAYANAMGGAVTAAPYDTTTAVSNPAGMVLIDKKADFNFEGFMPTRTADFKGAGGQDNQGGSPLYLVPAAGWVGPVNDTGDLVFGGGMFLVSGMGVDYDTINSIPFSAAYGDYTPWKANLYSQYQFWKLAPTLAKKVNDNLSVGVALNIDYQQMAFKNWFTDPNNSANYMGADLSRAVGTLGYGVTVGAVYKVNDMISFGATYISEQNFGDMEYRLSAGDVAFPTGQGTAIVSGDGTYKMKMNFPQQIAIGLALKPMENLKITADYKWINFKKTHESIDLKGDYAVVSQTTGQMVGAASALPLAFGWDDVSVIAVGAELKATDGVTLRAGYNHGNSPIKEEDVFNNLVFPAIVEDHLGLGVDFKLAHGWGLGLSYVKAFKKEITGSGDLMGQTSGAKIALEETSFILAISYNYGAK
ncbi:MAG: outer membrane protein transport protein [Nitrospinae bacterium]|nr:outer membrane protein transport protein [Nitrospinota bacterium]